MKKTSLFVLVLALITAAATAYAGAPDVTTIIKKSDEAINSMLAGTRKMTMTLKDGKDVTSEWVARRAYRLFDDGKRELMIFLEPDYLKGNAYMYFKPLDKPVTEWVYSTPTRRVRKLSGANAYESFFSTDFTYADLGIKDPGGSSTLLGEEQIEGRKVYKLETLPNEKYYYSRIVSLIACDNFVPIKREYFDAANRHWKTKLFKNYTVINNIPVPLKITIIDLQRNHSTDLSFSDICFDADYLTKEDFDPEKLSNAILSPVCRVPTPKN